MVVKILYHVEQFCFELALARRGSIVSTGHVLPDQQAEFIAPVIPSVRLYFDMLSGEIESGALEKCDVGLQRLVGGRGINSVGPEPLIQSADLEERLAVQADAREASLILDQIDLAHGKVTRNAIELVISLLQT